MLAEQLYELEEDGPFCQGTPRSHEKPPDMLCEICCFISIHRFSPNPGVIIVQVGVDGGLQVGEVGREVGKRQDIANRLWLGRGGC